MNIATIDLKKCKNAMEIHTAIQQSIGLPAWYGKNADALWDMLTGYIELPVTICLFLPQSSSASVNDEIKRILRVFKDAADSGYDITLLNGYKEFLE